MFRMVGRRTAAALAMSGVLVLGAAACGDDDSGGGSSSSGGGSTGEEAPADSGAKAGDTTQGAGVVDFEKYVGGTAGAADSGKSPIVIGWVNQQGGPADVGPGATKGAEMAVKYVNEELGGVEGHPIKLQTCFTSTSEEQGQSCGQKMTNDKDISVVNVGAVAIGAQSLDSTVSSSKPMVYGVAIGASNAKNKTGFALFGNGVSVSAPFGTFVSQVLKAKSTAVVWPELPGINESSQAIVASSKAAGLETKQVSWNPNATDLVGPLTAAGAQTADVIQANTDPKGCVNLAKALASLKIDTPVVSEPLCLNPDVAKALGDTPKWTYGIASSLATDTTDPAVAAYLKVAEKYGLGTASGDNWIPVAFAQIMTTVQWMNRIGADAITPDALIEQGRAFKGPLLWGPPTIECGKYPDMPAVCNDQTKFYDYEGKGKLTVASGWLGPPS
jgi:branched-chain amino acid transport system substrate-binding protein